MIMQQVRNLAWGEMCNYQALVDPPVLSHVYSLLAADTRLAAR